MLSTAGKIPEKISRKQIDEVAENNKMELVPSLCERKTIDWTVFPQKSISVTGIVLAWLFEAV